MAQDDKSFFIEAEAGLNFETVYKLPARCWNDLREIYASLKQAESKGEFPYSVVVVDTIDKVVEYAEEEIISRAREFYTKIADQINTIGDIPNGGGWSKTRGLVMNFIDKVEQLPCAMVLISHLTTKRIEEGVRKYDKHTISLWKGVGEDVLAWADHILHIDSTLIGDRLKRTVWTKPTQSRECKSRGGVIEDGWQWTENMAENYKKFRSYFK